MIYPYSVYHTYIFKKSFGDNSYAKLSVELKEIKRAHGPANLILWLPLRCMCLAILVQHIKIDSIEVY